MKSELRLAVLLLMAACSKSTPGSLNENDTLEGLTAQLQAQTSRFWAEGAPKAQQAQLLALAEKRSEVFAQIARVDAARALKNAVPPATRVSLPDAARVFVEQSFDGSGRIELEITDYRDQTMGIDSWLAGARPRRLKLYTTERHGQKRQRPFTEGATYQVKGFALRDFVVVEQAEQRGTPLAALPWAAEKVLVIGLSWSDVAHPLSAAQLQSKMFGASSSVAWYFSNTSNGTATLTGDVVGIYTAAQAQTCDSATITTVAMQAAAAAGVNLGNYPHILISAPAGSCSYVGKASGATVPSTAIILSNGSDFYQIANHELGHNMGLLHSHALLCLTTPLPADESGCSFVEYGHEVDEMSHGEGSYNPFQLQYLGWANRGTFGDITEVVNSGSYTISPLATQGAATRALKIPYQKLTTGATRYFYVEYRQATGVDAYLSASPISQRVFITLGDDTDADSSEMLYLDTAGGYAGLTTGGSFTAPNGMVLSVTSANSTAATLSITMPATSGTCTRAAPLILPAAPIINATTTAGSTVPYQMTVKNNDSTACAGSVFDMTVTGLPSGWSYTGPGSVALPAGASSTITFYITSSASAPAGSQTWTASANDPNLAGHSTTRANTYTVSTCALATPTITAVPTSNSGQANTAFNYSVSITNNSPSTCGSMTLNTVIGLAPKSGWSVSVSTVSVSPGQTMTTTMTITPPTGTANGTYRAGADLMFTTALTANSGLVQAGYQHQAVLTDVVVGTTCTHLPPQVSVSPSSQSGTGSAKTYTVTVKNIEGTNCTGSTTSTLSATPPSGWSASLTTSSFTLAPGASATSTLTVTPAGSPSAGYYVTTLTGTNAYGTVTSGAAYQFYCSFTTNPQITLSPAPGSGAAGETVNYTVGVKNQNPAGCGTTTYDLAAVMFSQNGTTGWVVTLADSTLSVPQGSTAYTTMSVTSPANAPAYWLYRISVTASDSLGNFAQNIVTYIIPCVRAVPTITLSPTSVTLGAGTSTAIAVTVKSNAIAGCAAEDFTLSAIAPSGWTSTYSDNPISLAGGATGTSTWTLRAVNGAPEGTYTPTLTATSPDGYAATATETVTVPCGVRRTPSVTISPASQSGSAGSTLAYTVSVTNNDGSNCAAQTFNLSSAIPSGWSGAFVASSLSLAGATTGSTTFNLTSAAGAATSDFDLTATGTVSGSASDTATWDVPCTRNAHTISLSPSTQSSTPAGALTYTVTVTNNDVGCTANTYTLSSSAPTGWTKSLSTNSLPVAAGSSATATYTVTSTASATGTNTVSVNAVPTNGTATSKTGSASYVVTCTRAAPTVSLSPSSQSGAAGTLKSYSVNVTNNDVGCGSSVFTLTKSAPGGWTNTLTMSSMTLASQASSSTNFNVTSPGNAAANTYSVSVTATSASSGATTGSASYVVTAPCVRGVPTVSISPSTQTGGPGAALTYTATVTNNDSNCASTTFNLSSMVPSGWSGAVNPTSLALASGTSGTTSFTATASTSALGTNSISVTANGGASGTSSGSASWVVSCTRNAPTVSFMPASQSGNAGTSLTYTARLTNNDVGCAASPFNVAVMGPSGWSVTPANASPSINSGAFSDLSISVGSPLTATGSNLITANVTNTASALTATANATWSVNCVRAAPTLSLAPSTRAGSAGSTLTYTYTVTNNDTGCADGTFTLSGTVPSLWTALFTPATLTASARGSVSGSFAVTSSASAPTGSNTVTATVGNVASGSGSGSATAVISPSCTRVAPTVSLTPATQSGAPGSALAFTVNVTNNDANCSAGTFTFSNSVPANWSAITSVPSLSLASGASGTATFTVTSSASSPAGSNTVSITATDAQSGSATATASWLVTPPCVRAAPTFSLSPASQSANAGSAASYAVNITNNDANCAATSFTLSHTIPSGWSANWSASTLSVGAGETATATFAITSAATAVGTNSFSVNLSGASTGAVSANGSYLVNCVAASPTLTITPSSQSGAPGSELQYALSLTSNHSGCAPVTFDFTASIPNGWSQTLNPTQLTLASGATGSATFSVTSAASAMGNSSVTVTASSPGVTAATATATFSVSCTRRAPGVTLSPSSQSAMAGSALTYLATVTNNDLGCAASSFTLTGTAPSGWSSVPTDTTLTLDSGANATTNLTVTSAATASGGNFSIGLTAANATSGSTSAAAGYTVTVPCVRAAPGVSLSPQSQSGAPGATLQYTAIITNNDVGCSDATFALSAMAPASWATALVNQSVNLAPGASTTQQLSITAPMSAGAGAESISLTATHAASGSGSSAATFDVVLTCIHNAPTLTLTPASQSGAAGTSVTYTATLTNNDTNCAAATFALTTSLPAQFTGMAQPNQLTLNAGASGTSQLTISSDAAATMGNSSFTVTAASATSGTASATGVYSVATMCTRHAPTVSLTPSTQGGTPGSTVAYTVTVTNTDVGCAPSTLVLSAIAPNGWAATLTAPSLTIGTGATATTTLSVTSAGTAPSGSYAIDLTAVSATSGTAMASATYVVGATCTPAAPTVTLSPMSQSATAGATLAWSATVTNNDLGCAPAAFDLSTSVPSGWSSVVTQRSAVLTSGASGVFTFSVTSAASATPGTSAFSFSANRASGGSATTSGSFIVIAGCVRATPSITFAQAGQTGAPGTTLTYIGTVTNHDTGCADAPFTLTATAPSAVFSTQVSPPSLTLAPQATGQITVMVTAAAGATAGNYSVPVDVVGASTSATATLTFSIANQCVHNPPSLGITPSVIAAPAGTMLTFTATIINNDVGCIASELVLTTTLPRGFTASSTPSSLTLGPGQLGTIAVQVTAPITATGTNTLTFNSGSTTTGSTNATATWEVPCVRSAPTLTFETSKLEGTTISAAIYAATLTNTDVGCAPTAFTLVPFVPAEWVAVLDSPSLSLAAGSQKQLSLTITPALSSRPADYVISLTATSASHDDASVDGTFTVPRTSGVCGCSSVDPVSALALLTLLKLRQRRSRERALR